MELFISYSRSDKQWVFELARELRHKQELEVWHDQDLVMGQDWWNEILKQIEECQYFMLILTPAYVNSAYCIRELEYAHALGKPILPLIMKSCDQPPLLRSIQSHDIEGQSLSDVVHKCAVALRKIETNRLKSGTIVGSKKVSRPPLPEQSSIDPISFDDTCYRQWLRERTDTIDIRGIGVGYTREAHRFSLMSLYMPLHARPSKKHSQRDPLEERVIAQRYTIVLGSPGSGKTTFLNHLSRTWVDLPDSLPLLMRASELYEYIYKSAS